MALEKLTAKELAGRPGGRPRAEYVAFLSELRVGQGGRAVVAEEGVTRQALKNRLKVAAAAAGVEIKFQRSSPEDVVFEMVSRTGAAQAGKTDMISP